LIVCEGGTEVNYFKGLIGDLKLSTVNIEILDIKQNTPDSLLREAKQLYQKAKRSGNPYDRVYCVFDKDLSSAFTNNQNLIIRLSYCSFSEIITRCCLAFCHIVISNMALHHSDLKDRRFPNTKII
jgi:hypothetical protein